MPNEIRMNENAGQRHGKRKEGRCVWRQLEIRNGRITEIRVGVFSVWIMELPGRRKRGSPQRSFVDVVKEDTQRVKWR